MTRYDQMSADALKQELQDVQAAFEAVKAKNLKLDMSRGKPGKAQLDLASGILSVLAGPADCTSDGMDVRNYGELMGLPSCRKLFATAFFTVSVPGARRRRSSSSAPPPAMTGTSKWLRVLAWSSSPSQ